MDKKGVIVTGASSGIGEACALHLSQLGFRVFAGVRRQADGKALQAQAAGSLSPVILDVTDPETISAAANQIQVEIKDSDLAGLVNNAGIAVACPLEFVPLDVLRRQLEVNVIGQIAVTQAFMPLLRKNQGRVVFISSISGRIASPLLGPYAASKFALEGLADALRRELIPWGIRVSVIQPGRVNTPIWNKSLAAAEDLLNAMPGEVHQLYGEMISSAVEGVRHSAKGAPMEDVNRAVVHALTAARPRTRYLIGQDARIGAAIARLLPDRLIDRLYVYQRNIRK
jgi:NAD(P)-dependent dehydrogenase (short-subunit alcohol dehydrogenase family)